MEIKNYECKVKVDTLEPFETLLLTQPNIIFKGIDHQTDTYFNATQGRLKLREGNIENALIQYNRSNTASAKQSDILLYQHNPSHTLKQILIDQLGVKVVVDKIRKIYFIDNIKFHLDKVNNLGTFVEIEAIDTTGTIPIEVLKGQCEQYIEVLQIPSSQFVAQSYSDLLLKA